MEQVQVEEQKYLTIDELMPTWSQLLDLYLKNIDEATEFKAENEISFLNPQKCCVGESWKFRDGYANHLSTAYCDICTGFSFKNGMLGGNGMTFSNVIREVTGNSNHNWRDLPVVKEFVKHFNEQHINKT